MKSFSAILLFGLTLFTILAPCADGIGMVLEKGSKNQVSACCQASGGEIHDLPGANTHSEESPGHCSPLCYCACCGQVATIQQLSLPVQPEVAAAQHQPVFVGVNDFEYTHYIWQPPRQG